MNRQKHPDALLLFRCGDFYETYAQDAVEASAILGITLTRRNNGKDNMPSTEMAGFPHHALDTYLPKLVRAGRRVAIAASSCYNNGVVCGCNSMVEYQPSKLGTWVRFPSPAPDRHDGFDKKPSCCLFDLK